MKAVINASPLINLTKIRRLGLLNEFFGIVFIPNAVLHEIRGLDINKLSYTSFHVGNRFAVDSLLGGLHLGEAEVIVGTTEIQAKYAVIDDLNGRKKAGQLGLDVIGTLGILQKAQKHSLISTLEQDIYLLKNAGMYISDALIQKIINIV